jgi:transcriptional regulator with XRE-family HTH domain
MTDKKQKTKGKPDPVDIHVGHRLRVRRSLLGLSQEKLADAIGLTFQQIQKYERGMNRITAGRLYQFSKILEVPITYFFDKFGSETSNQNFQAALSDNDQENLMDGNVMNSKETLELIRAYYAIDNAKARKEIYRFIKSMSEHMK